MSEYSRVAEHLFIRKNTGRYYAIIKKNCRLIRRSLKTRIRSIANARLFNLQLDIGAARSKVVRQRDIPTFAKAVAEVVSLAKKRLSAGKMSPRTLESIEGHLRLAREKLGRIRVSQLRPNQVKEYLDERELECSGRTVQIDTTHLRRVFELAKEKGWMLGNPMASIKPYKANPKKVRIPTTEDVKKVLDHLRGPDCVTVIDGKKAADFIEFLCLSGVRCQGAQTLRWEQINFERGVFPVTEKGNKTREVNLFPGLRTWLEARRQPSGLLFGKTHQLKDRTDHQFKPRKSLVSACKHTGVAHFTFHACRHYFATHCLEAGISASTVAGWLGHSDNGILVMRLYGNHLAKQHFATEAARVPIQFSSTSVGAEPRLRLAQ